MKLISLILSLPTENATVRQRTWRALKASGAAVLRDGVYLMPAFDKYHIALDALAADVNEAGGTAYVLRVEIDNKLLVANLFNRGDEYAALLSELAQVREMLGNNEALDVSKRLRKLRKSFDALVAVDFFPGEAQQQTDGALSELELSCKRLLALDEPHAFEGEVPSRHITDYQGRIWATRQRPWVDRLASAWLIRRFIDPQANFLWLECPENCPRDALSFDFDGATFSHVGSRVTFEVLVQSFGLNEPALSHLGLLVHFLDVGGVQPLEAVGVESVLAGMRESIANDDQLLAAASCVFDGLLAIFAK